MGKICTSIDCANDLRGTLFMSKKKSKNIVLLTIPGLQVAFLQTKARVKPGKMP